MSAYSMSTPVSPHYRYDSQETLEQFRARQQQAFAAGRRAWRERLIKAQLLPFYEALVGYVGQNQYAWVKEQTLADEFEVHVATIKRWLAKLEDAGLIRRQRRFATSSLTFITVYDRQDDDTTHADGQCVTVHNDREPAVHRQNEDVQTGPTVAPTLGAKMPPDSIKNDHLRSVGGRKTPNNRSTSPEIQHILAREGVTDFLLAPLIQQKTVPELQAISTYLSRQHNVRDRRRLFAWLASRDFGAQLLHGRRCHGHTKGQAAVLPRSSSAPMHLPPAGTTLESSPVCATPTGHQALWHAVLATVQRDVAPVEFATWLENTSLVEVDAERQTVVIGTPNVFARDAIQQRYLAVLTATLAAQLQQSYTIEVVIDGC
ncbi:MAG: helix-turn-helix domain-containing protein [Chloroflexota bacterium]|nr:helix-turn-helix domain-containing protein [Chloroflexota bacterium]